MEPRPSRPSRATGQSSTRATRTPWTPPPTVEPQATQQRTADIYGAPPNQGGGQWYGQQPGVYAPDPSDYRQTGPITPIKPRNERGNKLLRYLLAALLLVAVIGGGAYGITRFLDRDDSSENPPVAAVTDGTATPESSATEAPANEETEPTSTTAPAEPTATTAAAEPTEPPANDQAVAPASDAETTDEIDTQGGEESTAGTVDYLPDAAVLGGDWTISDEGDRSKADVGAQLGADGENLLTSWRWRENIYRDLTRTDPLSYPDETTFVNVSVHRFANAEGAAEALTYLSDIVVSAQGLQDVETPAIGDLARGLYGPGDGVNLYVLYVQDGNYLLRLGGASATGDPSATVNALAEEILAAQAGA